MTCYELLELCYRLTIWTVVLAKKMTSIYVIDEAGIPHTVTASTIHWMLATGWIIYIISQLLNILYYSIHPSSPEMWTKGAAEVVEEWTPPGEGDTQEGKGEEN